MRGPPRAIVAAAAVLGGIGGCRFDEVTVPVGREQPVVHAVLRTRQLRLDKEYVVLLERTLTGRVSVDFDADMPAVGLSPMVWARRVSLNIPATVSPALRTPASMMTTMFPG